MSLLILVSVSRSQWRSDAPRGSMSTFCAEHGISRKKPRASYRRFVYPAPNACWQLDATEYVLTAALGRAPSPGTG